MTTANILSQLGSPGVSTGFKNRLINGDFSIAQRAASSAAGGYCCVDRWSIQFSTAALTASQTTATVNGVLCSVLNIAGNAGNTASYQFQRIESANSKDMAGQSATVSFWVYQTTGSAQTFSTQLAYAGSTDNWGSSTLIGTITSTSVPSGVWTYVTGTIAIPSAATTGLQLTIFGPAMTANYYQLARVQLEVGTAATNFEVRDYGREVLLCQRYYQTYPYQTLTAGAYGTNSVSFRAYPYVTMRATPTFTYSGTVIEWVGVSQPTLTSGSNNCSATKLHVDFSFTPAITAYVPMGSPPFQLSAEL